MCGAVNLCWSEFINQRACNSAKYEVKKEQVKSPLASYEKYIDDNNDAHL